jgi:hypothetical protein
MELRKTKTQFVADGYRRWAVAREEKIRAEISQPTGGENPPAGFYEKFRQWFKTELAELRGRIAGNKSSPKILW